MFVFHLLHDLIASQAVGFYSVFADLNSIELTAVHLPQVEFNLNKDIYKKDASYQYDLGMLWNSCRKRPIDILREHRQVG